MPSHLLHGFRVGPWNIEPRRDAITGPDGEAHHLQPKVMDVFVCLAEHANELVTRDELLEAVWGGHAVFDEPLTRAIGELRRALQDDRGDPKYIETVPKRGYRLIGEVRLADGSPGQSATKGSRFFRHPVATLGAVGLVVIVVLYFVFDKGVMTGETTNTFEAEKSIAVLAFADLSPEGDQEYFSDGISEELLNALAKIPGLRVVARSSSFQFKGENRDVIDIGQQLNVALVLEGSVRKAGAQIRITAQLVDASNGFHLWSETYDRELANIFAVQDEISAAIVVALKEHLGLQVEAAPRVIAAANTEAHEAYLRGRYLLVQRTPATVEGAVHEFEKAIALDPEYALSHAELAIAISMLNRDDYGDLTVTEAVARAAPHVERAMALDPNLAEAHAATGHVLLIQGNFEEALTHFEQAIQLNPNYSIVYTWLGIGSIFMGHYDESFAAHEKGLRLDPLSLPTHHNYVGGLIARNRLAEADREIEKFASISPSLYATMRGRLASVGGKWAYAVLGDLEAFRIDPERVRRTVLSWYFAAIGLEKEALAISESPGPLALRMLGKPDDAVTVAEARVADEPDSLWNRHDLGLALASAGDYARARPILEEMWQRSGGRITSMYRGLLRTDSAAALIVIRRDAGKEAEVGELVAAIRDNVRRYREAGLIRGGALWGIDYEEGFAAYLSGERERGLALIARGVEDGAFIPQREAYLQVLYDDPGFAPIRKMQETRQARERERFLTIVCTDNPYAAVWQPAEGTCERFATGVKN